jgi:hypothetical protein
MASIGEWVVGAFINFSGNGVREMQRLAASANAANDALARQKGILTRDQYALNQYARRMEEIAANRQRVIGNVAGTVALAGVAAMTDAVTQASKLQTIFVAIQNATGATASQMEQYSQRFYNIADKNGMSVQDAADIVRVFARASGGRMSLGNIMNMTEQGGAQFAMIMKNARGESYDEAATQAITLAHMFRAYDPKSQDRMFDAMAHLGEMMPHNLNAAITQMGYFLPKLKTMGVSDSDAVAMMAWLDQSGYGRGKGGTGLRTLVEQGLGPLQLTTHAQGFKKHMLEQMGLINAAGDSNFYNAKTNQFDVFGYFQHISDWFAKQPNKGRAIRDITGTFGTQGGNIAALLEDPLLVSGLRELRNFSQDRRISQHEQAGKYENTVAFQAGRAWHNFQSLMTDVAGPWLNDITAMFRSIGDKLHAAQAYLHAHKDVEKAVGVLVFTITTVATALAGLASLGLIVKIGAFVSGAGSASSAFMGPLGWLDGVLFRGVLSKVALGLIDLFTGSGGFAMLLRFVGPWLMRFVPFVGWVVLAIQGLTLLAETIKRIPTIVTAIHNWWAQWQGPIGYTIGYVFGVIERMITAAIQEMLVVAGATVQALGSNSWLLATGPGGYGQLAIALAQAQIQAQKDWDSTHHLGFGDEFGRGHLGGVAGHSFQPHFDVRINVSPNGRGGVNVDSVTVQHGSSINGTIRTGPFTGARATATLGAPGH